MAGYVRQSVASIINGANITAPPLNAEFNALAAAFNGTTGHTHTGVSGDGTKIPLATAVTGFLAAINGGVGGRNNTTATTNPTVGSDSISSYAVGSIWVNVSTGRSFVCLDATAGAAVWAESLNIVSNNVLPQTTGTVNLGSTSLRFNNGWFSTNLTSGGLVTGTASIDTLTVTTGATFSAAPVFNAGMTVNGATTLAGNLTVTGNTTLGDATSDTISFVGRMTSAIVPDTNNTRDLGSTSLRFRDIWGAGTATLATLAAASATVSGGTINNTVIGNTTPQAITGTSVTATTGFSGPLTGNVTGNLTGNVTGAVTGNVTGNLTGNVTASSGTSTFTNVTINGTLDMNAGTAATVTGLSAPVGNTDAATKLYVDTSIANLIASAPGTLDTLNELAAALGNDPNFATTVTNEIATKVSKAGDTMTGSLAMSSQKITGLGTPTAGNDATNKTYVDNGLNLKLSLTGGTMSGVIAMGNNRITGLQDPSNAQDAATKNYIDTTFGSTASAAASAAAALVSENNALNSANAASASATNALNSANSAASLYDQFDDRYLGQKAANPTVDNDGNTLLVGALYFNTASNEMRVWNGSSWQAASTVGGTVTSLNTTGDLTEQGSPVVTQTDVGTAPNQLPLNQYLGNLAYQNAESIAGPVVVGGTLTAAGTASTAPSSIDVNSASTALRITQTGTGNALVVEDSASPDSTPFVVNQSGTVIVGGTTELFLTGVVPSFQIEGTGNSASSVYARYSADTEPPRFFTFKSRNATVGSHTIVNNNDALSEQRFYGSDGTKFIQAAQITAAVDGTPDTNDMPGRLVFSTTAAGASTPTERMRIDSAGNVGIGASSVAFSKILAAGVYPSNSGLTQVFRTTGTVPSTTTSAYWTYLSAPVTQAATFTIPNFYHFSAEPQAFGAGSTVTNQYGFHAASGLTGATNNYGLYSNIASGTGRWNFYAAGSAANYFAGNVGIGITAPTCSLDVVGGIKTSRTSVTAPAASDGNVFSGTYTPTLTNATNISSSTAFECQYIRVGNVVTVSGAVAVTPTAAGGASTILRVSLPIASALSASTQLGGTAVTTSETAQTAACGIAGDTTNNVAQFAFFAQTTSALSFFFSFTYRVI
jgi:hypothetical protein